MPVAIEPMRFYEHKIYHIILQEMRKESFEIHIHDVIYEIEHFYLQKTPLHQRLTGAKGSNRTTFKKTTFSKKCCLSIKEKF